MHPQQASGKWLASFLVPQGTPQGIYQIRVLITRASGEQLSRSLRYRVDGTAPRVSVTVDPKSTRPGATVTLRARPLGWEPLPATSADEIGDPGFAASVRQDLESGEALLPSGQTLHLARHADGSFSSTFAAPNRAGRYPISVVARDFARNKARQVFWLQVGEKEQ